MQPIVVIGPTKVGKTTISKMIADKYKLNHFDMDKIDKNSYFSLLNINQNNFETKQELLYSKIQDKSFVNFSQELYNLLAFNNSFQAKIIMHLLKTEKNCVIDIGGDSFIGIDRTPYNSIKLLQTKLCSSENVILLTPSNYINESAKYIMKKSIQRNDEYIPHPKILIKSMETAGFNKMQNYKVFTKDKTQEQVFKEVDSVVQQITIFNQSQK